MSALELLESLRDSEGDICTYDLPEQFEIVDEGEWTQDRKYQECTVVVMCKITGSHFAISRTRSGSYHTDWYYSDAVISQVVKTVKTIEVIEWVSL